VADVVAGVDLEDPVGAAVGRADEGQAPPAIVDQLQVGAGAAAGQ